MTTTHLVTIRDYLRFAVSRFRAAKLEHGHGASTALDEAAFLILETLNLPVDDINPWLDAKLLPAEREKLASIIEARITTRKPAAYLTKRTYIHGVPFYVDERVIVPRSYIGELLFSGLFGGDGHNLVKHPEKIGSVLDLCLSDYVVGVFEVLDLAKASEVIIHLEGQAHRVHALVAFDALLRAGYHLEARAEGLGVILGDDGIDRDRDIRNSSCE